MIPQPSRRHPRPTHPVIHLDPNMFRRDDMSRLGELTVNSRPIIQNLSVVAQEYSRYAEIVAQRIRPCCHCFLMCLVGIWNERVRLLDVRLRVGEGERAALSKDSR